MPDTTVGNRGRDKRTISRIASKEAEPPDLARVGHAFERLSD